MADGFDLSELARRLENLLRLGTIAQLDEAAARVRVQSGDLLTGWVPWLTRRAGPDSDWWAPEPGEQVLLLCPSGEPALGVALPAIYQTAHPAPGNVKTKRVVEFADGMKITYDRAAMKLTIDCPGEIEITCAGNFRVTAARIDLN